MNDVIHGGLADHSNPHDFNPKQLKKGIEHELEHTDCPKIAREIAMDHLMEDPMYYTKLDKIEEVRMFVRSFLAEHWDQHLSKVIDPGEDLPFDENPDERSDDPLNPYDANKTMSTVRAKSHTKSLSQKAGVGKGSGSPGGSRFPGGHRQGTSSRN